MTKLEQAFNLFDTYNQQDPSEVIWNGQNYPAEYFYAIKLYEWVKKLDPEASESLLLASRCQHIGRWEIARKAYPEGRVGYLRWRNDLSKFHAQKAAEILQQLGYEMDMIDRVKEIVLKKQLKTNTEVQTMENALCLVFLEFQYDDLIKKQPAEKMIDILQKTWAKMSDSGRQVALSLTYREAGKTLLNKALESAGS
ncbi:DUF4202 domain-containing protein [Paraflavitalea sp. CAU 1676]|uniref:DUF4202 domain-containing protein n=1 Tax=Paraflavitalea sp. CAU 1676 TaxID=3032598 RepID=UPI0023DA9C67|nr:DUF4202 domain-containing protein [Paraflavitalea sp. CAU 1676]MDF2190364.1 DUF4202 domain-containing protein [Paraflavitalea sp. CAU 1676]